MKKLFLVLTAVTFTLASCDNDDENNVPSNETPSAVTATFTSDFPNATDISYEKRGNDFEVDFDVANVDHEALYTSSGLLVKYKYDVLLSQLPQAIKSTVTADFGNRMIDDTEVLMIDEVAYYQLELENQPNDDQLVFNADGTLNSEIAYWD